MKNANLFREILKEEKTTIRKVASHLGVTAQCLSNVLRGISFPSLPVAAALEEWSGGRLQMKGWLPEVSTGDLSKVRASGSR